MIEKQDLPRRVGRRIAELRSSLGMTQEALAVRLGIALKNLQRIEGGQNLTLRSVERIAHALGVEIVEIFAAPIAARALPGRMTATATLMGLTDAGIELCGADAKGVPAGAVPVTTLRAAAGRLRATREVEALAWAVLPGRRCAPGSFLARVAGRSLEPRYPDGSWALFRAPATVPVQGRVVLLARGAGDHEHDAFLLKKVAAVRRLRDGSLLVTLASFNPAYPAFDIHVAEESDLRAVADLVRLITPRKAPSRTKVMRR